MLHRLEIRKALRLGVIAAFALLCLAVPIVLFYVALHRPGIDLPLALAGPISTDTFSQLFSANGPVESAYRDALLRSIVYATTVAAITAFVAGGYGVWASSVPRRISVVLSFTLLTFVLLPQTYLILPVLVAGGSAIRGPLEPALIVGVISVGTIPIGCWMFHLMADNRLRRLLESTALDGAGGNRVLARVFSEMQIEILLTALVAWGFAWGNFLVPYAFGSSDTYSALVQVVTFTSNLGRDWAMIAAAGFVLVLPALLITAAIMAARFGRSFGQYK